MAVSAARSVAFDLLMEVETRGSYAVDLLHSERTASLSALDTSLCTQLVMGVLRWQSQLDEELRPVVGEARIQKLDLEVLIALRLGVFQMRHLERIPMNAIVNESVELVKRARKKSAAPFANAVLRKLSASTAPAFFSDESAQGIARTHAHPVWLVEGWAKQYGSEATEKVCAFNQRVPETCLRVRPAERESITEELAAAGVVTTPGQLLTGSLRVQSGDVTRTKAYRDGRIAIQDEASQLVAVLVGNGKRILDCCAAPGGKTAAIAERNPEAKVTAVEVHEHRMRLLRKRLAVKNVEFVHADITKLATDGKYDRILADVPCSGTGTLARNPEIKWKLRPADLDDLQLRQCAILSAALDRLEPGGALVYSTCSLENSENEEVVSRVVAQRRGFRIMDCRERLHELKRSGDLIYPQPESLCRRDYLRTLPGVHPGDGFFAAMITTA